MTRVNCQAVNGFLIKVVKPYSSKFFAMMADDRNYDKYASIWCKNETKSLIRENPVVNLRGRKQKSRLKYFILICMSFDKTSLLKTFFKIFLRILCRVFFNSIKRSNPILRSQWNEALVSN